MVLLRVFKILATFLNIFSSTYNDLDVIRKVLYLYTIKRAQKE